LDFEPFRFNVNDDTCFSECEKDEQGEFTQGSNLKTFLCHPFMQSDLCALSHFSREISENVADLDVEILHDLGMLNEACKMSDHNGKVSEDDERTSEGAFQWVMQAPLLLFKDSAVFITESDE
jgi:hypothetical protein